MCTRKFFKNELPDPDPFASALYDDAQFIKIKMKN